MRQRNWKLQKRAVLNRIGKRFVTKEVKSSFKARQGEFNLIDRLRRF